MTVHSEDPAPADTPNEVQEIPSLEQLLENRRAQHESARQGNRRKAGSPVLNRWFISGASVAAVIVIAWMQWPDTAPAPPAPVASAEPESALAPAPPPAPPLPLPAPGPVDASTQPPTASSDAPDLPALIQRGSVAATSFPTLELPIEVRHFSMDWVQTAILNEGKLPPDNAVRLEEILNSFSFRLNGSAAVAGSPDKESGPRHLATLAAETLPCPWKPSATLVLISLRGNPEHDCDVKLAFHSNPENVFRYRLLGFATVAGSEMTPLPTRLPAKSTTVLALEIEPSRPGNTLGSLEWSANGIPAPHLQLSHRPDTEPSDDARFAALVCSFAQWLAGDQTGVLDADIVAALAREISSSSLPADREEFLNLVDRTIHF